MAPTVKNPARLIAVDGSRGADVEKSARRLAAVLKKRGVDCVISRWDASGLFGELAQGEERAATSPRTLSLVYAADLAFRLRWEIQPALADGAVVIAAAYVETAIALGGGCGLPQQWLRELLRFAPVPTLHALARERKLERSWKPRLDRGYPDYCAALFEANAAQRLTKKTRRAVIDHLAEARGRRVYRLDRAGLDRAAKAITSTRPAVPSPSPSRPRSARK